MEQVPAGRSVGEGFTPNQEEEDRVWQTESVSGVTPRRKSLSVIATVGLLEKQMAVSMSCILSGTFSSRFTERSS